MASATSDTDPVIRQATSDRKARVEHEVEEYDCGCRVQFRQVDYGESGNEVPRNPLVVPEYSPCFRHKGAQSIPPRDARLVKVRREYESFLNE